MFCPFLFFVAAAAAGVLFHRQVRVNRALAATLVEAREGQKRAFDFLDGLGNHLEKNLSPSSMHRFVVDGLVEVLTCEGAALYLLDASRQELVPMAISARCPLFLDVPRALLAASTTPADRLNFLRLHPLPVSHPVFGEVFRSLRTLKIDNLSEHPAFAPPPRPEPVPESGAADLRFGILAAALVYADKPIGLAIACGPPSGRPFSGNDRSFFESLVRKSAFALGSAMVHREAHEKRLLEAELRTASEFQRILLPAHAPGFSGYSISGVNYPARIVSGDYFDYVPVDSSRLGIVIGDVAGKGFPAALIMATCRSVLRTRAIAEPSPAKVLSVVNRQIFPDIREDMFITMLYAIIETDSGLVHLSRAGHRAALVYRAASGSVESIAPVGLALGIDEGDVFDRVIADCQTHLGPGDVMLLYTDGLTEATDPSAAEYGTDRLEAVFTGLASLDAEGIVSALCEDVRQFSGSGPQSDDITLIAIKKDSIVRPAAPDGSGSCEDLDLS